MVVALGETVIEEVEREGIKPEVVPDIDPSKIIEITNLHEGDTQQNIEAARKLREEAQEMLFKEGKVLDAKKYLSPSLEELKELNAWNAQEPLQEVRYGNLDGFSDAALDEAIKTPAHTLSIDFKDAAGPYVDSDGVSNFGSKGADKLARAFERLEGKEFSFKELHIENDQDLFAAGYPWERFVEFDIKEISLSRSAFYDDELLILQNETAKGKIFHFGGLRVNLPHDAVMHADWKPVPRDQFDSWGFFKQMLTSEDYRMLQNKLISEAIKSPVTVYLSPAGFFELLTFYPELLTSKIYPDTEGTAVLENDIESYEKFEATFHGASEQQTALAKRIDELRALENRRAALFNARTHSSGPR